MDPYFYLFIKLLSAFFLFSVKMQTNKIKLCYNRLPFVKETQINTVYNTKRRAKLRSQIIRFSLIFARCYVYKNLGTDIQILQSWLAGWCMHCVTLRLHDIEKLQKCSVQMRENTDQDNSEYEQSFYSVITSQFILFPLQNHPFYLQKNTPSLSLMSRE